MKIVAFTGAGVSKESGINTFRDGDGLWKKYDPEIVSSKVGWKKNREIVIDFYNTVRKEMINKVPNDAHKYLAKLEEYHDVSIITQNVDDLHERAGSTNVIHLHGELNKTQSSLESSITYPYTDDIKIGDKCELGSQIRPHVVLFGELPNNVEKAYEVLKDCDLLLVIGTSLNIIYTISMLESIDEERTTVIYIDPNPSSVLDGVTHVDYIKEPATVGMKIIYDGL